MHRVYIIEGLDRLGKSTLIENIQRESGFYQTVHMSKPKKLPFYERQTVVPPKLVENNEVLFMYQRDSFITMFNLIHSDAHLIFDRAHLGEAVYAPLYRGYSGDYVFELERAMNVNDAEGVRLILLTEDFKTSKHFVDDGESFDITKREQEQQMFLNAVSRSRFKDKKIICVTDTTTGQFRSQMDILTEAIQ
jgi:thymidylate kinase